MRLGKMPDKPVYDDPWKSMDSSKIKELITNLERVVKALKKGADVRHGICVKRYSPTLPCSVISRTDKWLVFEGDYEWTIERKG